MRSLSAASLLSLTLCASAATISKRAVNQATYDLLSLYEQYAAASYCPSNDGASQYAPVTCSTGNCPKVQASDTSIVLSIPTTSKTDTASFLAIDHTNSLIAISFRGSESVRNYLTDLETSLTSVDLCDGCEGFTGMYEAWGEVQDQIIPAVKSAQSSYPSYRIVVTGHSLGAGIAYVVAPALRKLGLVVDMALFAAPRVGNTAWVNYVIAQAPSLGNNYRVTHLYDPVPSVPSTSSGYAHVSPAYFIDALAGITPTPSDIEIQNGIYIDNNPTGPSLQADDDAHDFYFNKISICYPYNGVIPFKVGGANRPSHVGPLVAALNGTSE